VALTWFLVLYVCVLWLGLAGDVDRIGGFLSQLNMYYPGGERWVVTLAAFLGWAGLSWRFMVSGLASGLSGSKAWYYASNSVTAAILMTLLACFIWAGDSADHSLHLYNLWSAIMLLPVVLAVAVIAKAAVAAWAWNRAHQAKMVSARNAASYLGVWTLCTGLFCCVAYLAFAHTPWLRNLVCLGTFLILPLATPGVAMLAWSANRTGTKLKG